MRPVEVFTIPNQPSSVPPSPGATGNRVSDTVRGHAPERAERPPGFILFTPDEQVHMRRGDGEAGDLELLFVGCLDDRRRDELAVLRGQPHRLAGHS